MKNEAKPYDLELLLFFLNCRTSILIVLGVLIAFLPKKAIAKCGHRRGLDSGRETLAIRDVMIGAGDGVMTS